MDEYNQQNDNSETTVNDVEHIYKSVNTGKQNSRLFSIISLVLSAASVLCCLMPALGILLGLAAIFCGLYSRRNIGYFDGLSVGGIITSIFGVVFSVAVMILLQIIH